MDWIRRQGTRVSGRSIVLLSSVLALLALACFPVLAQADSAGAQYVTGINGAGGHPEGGEKIAKKSESPKPQTGGATAPPEGGSSSPESGGGSYTESPSSGSESGGAATAQKNESGKGQGKADNGTTPKGKAAVQHAAPTPSKSPESSDDDGSSPLLPILIGLAVLAAISVGAFLIRQRRQRDAAGGSLSTKAG